MEDLPTYWEYKAQVDRMVESDQLTVEQAVILLRCFNATLQHTPVHINQLMHISSLNWTKVNYLINGLIQRGAIRKIEEKILYGINEK